MPTSQDTPNLSRYVGDRVESVVVDESLPGLLGAVVGGRSRDKPPWWFVTDVVNPAAAYWRRLGPPIPTDPAIAQRLRFGKAIHDAAESWFRRVERFAASEGTVDGAHIGMGGVRGRIDFRIGDSIIELKTTDRPEVRGDEILSRYPHDLEQLVLYALFTKRETEAHRLVYYKSNVEPPFTSFRVRITTPGPLRHAFEQRLKLLSESVAASVPDRLGRCRYFESGCDYNLQGICSCRTAAALPGDALRSCVRIEPDPEFDRILETARQQARQHGPSGLSIWDLIVPRQAYLRLSGLGVPYYEDDEARNAAWRLLHDAVEASTLGFQDAALELDGISLGISESLTFAETSREGITTTQYPILVKGSGASSPFRADRLPPAYLTQLGIRCALSENQVGLILVAYSNNPGLFNCYRVRYRDAGGILAEARRSLRDLTWAVAHHDPGHLPPCEQWLRGTCAAACLCRGLESAV